MYRRRVVRQDTHTTQEDLEKQVIKIQPTMNLIEKVSKLPQNATIKSQIQEAGKEAANTIEQLQNKFGVSYIDAVSRIEAEKFKGDIAKIRQEAEQREMQGQGQDDDITDLVDENGILLHRVQKGEQVPPVFNHYIKKYDRYIRGLPEYRADGYIEEEEKANGNLRQFLGLPEGHVFNPKHIIKMKKQPGHKSTLAEQLEYKAELKRQNEEAKREREEREEILEEMRRIIAGRQAKDILKKGIREVRAKNEDAKREREVRAKNEDAKREREEVERREQAENLFREIDQRHEEEIKELAGEEQKQEVKRPKKKQNIQDIQRQRMEQQMQESFESGVKRAYELSDPEEEEERKTPPRQRQKQKQNLLPIVSKKQHTKEQLETIQMLLDKPNSLKTPHIRADIFKLIDPSNITDASYINAKKQVQMWINVQKLLIDLKKQPKVVKMIQREHE